MKTKVLMVCLGNICRSPLAEELLRSKVDPDKVEVDSAGTSDYHIDDQPDERSVDIAKKNDLDITHQRGRQFTPADFDKFDHIYVMDNSNYANVVKLSDSDEQKAKVKLILNTLFPNENADVPDPYYGGEKGFEDVFDLLDKSTDVIVKDLEG